jgi:outer membrane protein OmpA-like peptidoglycan-associated protein
MGKEKWMKRNSRALVILGFALAILAAANYSRAQETDAEGCKDHPLFTRMKNYYITNCEKNFDAVEFTIADGKTETVEGDKTVIDYNLKEGAQAPSGLQIIRNYETAVKSLGGVTLYQDANAGAATFKLVKNNREIWVSIATYNGTTGIQLIILEKGEMVQEVTADAMYNALNKDGFMALYINFDTGKSDIKPESMPIIDQIAVLMKAHADLKISIEGHTDNVGTPASNKTLSEQRAKSVMNAVVQKGIAAGQLSAVGWGQDKPIADNRSEDGRAKNRRVEIVKK